MHLARRVGRLRLVAGQVEHAHAWHVANHPGREDPAGVLGSRMVARLARRDWMSIFVAGEVCGLLMNVNYVMQFSDCRCIMDKAAV